MKNAGFVLWVSLIVFSFIVIGIKLSSGLPLENNILALLPKQTTEEKWIHEAKDMMQTQASSRIIVVVSDEDIEQAQNASMDLRNALEREGFIHPSKDGRRELSVQEVGQVYFPYRMGLLSDQDRKFLKTGDVKSVYEDAIAQMFSPFGIADSDLIQRDPYLFLPRYFSELPIGQTKYNIVAGLPTVEKDGEYSFILDMELVGEPYSPKFQAQFIPFFNEFTIRLKNKSPSIDIKKMGAVFYANHATSGAKTEASRIGLVSIVAILLLAFFIFRGLQPIWMSLLAIVSGVSFALAVNLIIFDKIHLMALVFGAGLMGIAVDNAFHYCCERFSASNKTPLQRINAILPSLTLGLISSVIGFMTLALTPFPGLQQIAVFSTSGLIMSYLTVVFIFPKLDHGATIEYSAKKFWLVNVYQKLWSRADNNTAKWIGLAVISGVVCIGYIQLDVDDDIRRLQSLPKSILAEEAAIKQLTGIENDAQFYLVKGTTQEDTLITEEALRTQLEHLIEQNRLSDYTALSTLVPSAARQQENRKLISDHLLGDHLSEYLQTIDLNRTAGYSNHSEGFLTLEQLETLGSFASLMMLQIEKSKDSVVHLIALKGVKDVQSLAMLGAENDHIRFVDPAYEISKVLTDYRQRALALLAVAGVIIFGFLSLRYGAKRALMVIAAPMLAVVLTPFIIALMGGGFTFFNAMALMLVFALGLDYALFCTESSKENLHISLLANGLSALSTIFAFGLLALSQQYAVHAFGQTILIGIILAFGLAPFAQENK